MTDAAWNRRPSPAAPAAEDGSSPSALAVAEALYAAVSAIYFDDSADHLRALWSVVRELAPDIAELLEEDRSAAWHRASDLRDALRDARHAAAELVRAAGSVQDAPMRWLGEVRDEFRKMADEANRVLSEHCSRVLDAGSVQGKISDEQIDQLQVHTEQFRMFGEVKWCPMNDCACEDIAEAARCGGCASVYMFRTPRKTK